MITVNINGEFHVTCKERHVDSVVDALELDGIEVIGEYWTEETVELECVITE
jgi:hypothetical protein